MTIDHGAGMSNPYITSRAHYSPVDTAREMPMTSAHQVQQILNRMRHEAQTLHYDWDTVNAPINDWDNES